MAAESFRSGYSILAEAVDWNHTMGGTAVTAGAAGENALNNRLFYHAIGVSKPLRCWGKSCSDLPRPLVGAPADVSLALRRSAEKRVSKLVGRWEPRQTYGVGRDLRGNAACVRSFSAERPIGRAGFAPAGNRRLSRRTRVIGRLTRDGFWNGQPTCWTGSLTK